MAKSKDNSKKEMPFWYFIIKGRIVSVRADNRGTAFKRARASVGMAS